MEPLSKENYSLMLGILVEHGDIYQANEWLKNFDVRMRNPHVEQQHYFTISLETNQKLLAFAILNNLEEYLMFSNGTVYKGCYDVIIRFK
jgi:hypothetical protein